MSISEKPVALPFCPLPMHAAAKIAKPFRGFGQLVSDINPMLDVELKQARISLNSVEYGAIAFMLVFAYAVFMGGVGYAVGWRLRPDAALALAALAGLVFGAMVWTQMLVYPKILTRRKVREIDRELVFALRTILVELKSGVSLFEALKTVAEGDYGALSKEFKETIQNINTGTPEKDALDEMAEHNPSKELRRTLWQVVNGLRAGADVSIVLMESVNSLTREQGLQLRRYGAQLRVLSLVYMMLGVIIPALGITFLIVMSTFPQIEVTEWFYWGLLGMLLVGQFLFVGMVKSKRPNLIGG